jgi:hypothetical protein
MQDAGEKLPGSFTLRVFEELLWRGLLGDDAIGDKQHLVGRFLCEADFVGDENHCHPGAAQAVDDVEDFLDHFGVERRSRLVEEPLGDRDFGVGYENHTSHPSPGQILLYPGGISETEIILAYGGLSFSSKMGQLAGNHFITIHSGLENLRALGERVLWKGAQAVKFSLAP